MKRFLALLTLCLLMVLSCFVFSSCEEELATSSTSSEQESSTTETESSKDETPKDETPKDETPKDEDPSGDLPSQQTEKYTVTFDADGGNAVSPQEVKKGEKATEPIAPQKDGYVFGGWYLGNDKWLFDSEINASITLKAKWEKAPVTVAFNSNGGSAVSSQEIKGGEKATAPTAPSRSGYVFKGWYLNGSLFSFDTAVTESITLEAMWNQLIKITFDYSAYNGVEWDNDFDEEMEAEAGVAIGDLPAPKLEGYTFKGWYKDTNNSLTKLDEATIFTEDTIYYAVFEGLYDCDNNKHKLSYEYTTPTCEVAGTKKATCLLGCGYEEVDTLYSTLPANKALGHKWAEDGASDPEGWIMLPLAKARACLREGCDKKERIEFTNLTADAIIRVNGSFYGGLGADALTDGMWGDGRYPGEGGDPCLSSVNSSAWSVTFEFDNATDVDQIVFSVEGKGNGAGDPVINGYEVYLIYDGETDYEEAPIRSGYFASGEYGMDNAHCIDIFSVDKKIKAIRVDILRGASGADYFYEVALASNHNCEDDGHCYKTVEGSTVKPSCTAAGYDVGKCECCGAEGKINRVNALGHSYEEVVVWKDDIVANCVTAGEAVVYERCQRCSEKNPDFADQHYTFAVGELPHDEEFVESVDATCQAEGYSLFKCKVCQSPRKVTTEQIRPCDFSQEGVLISEATCYQNRVELRTCTYADHTTNNQDEYEIPDSRVAHTPSGNIQHTGTSHDDCKAVVYCTACAEKFGDAGYGTDCTSSSKCDACFTNGKIHLYRDGSKVLSTSYTDPTCTKPGTKTTTCSVCNLVKIDTLYSTFPANKALGHKWAEDGASDPEGWIMLPLAKARACLREGCDKKERIEFTNLTADAIIRVNGSFYGGLGADALTDGMWGDGRYPGEGGDPCLSSVNSSAWSVTFEFDNATDVDQIVFSVEGKGNGAGDPVINGYEVYLIYDGETDYEEAPIRSGYFASGEYGMDNAHCIDISSVDKKIKAIRVDILRGASGADYFYEVAVAQIPEEE